MTVTTTHIRETKDGDDVTVSWSFTFVALDPSHVKVKKRNETTGAITAAVYATDFTVALTGTDRPAAGAITLINTWAATPPSASEQIEIYRDTPENQDVPLDPRSGFSSGNPERIFDKYILIAQEALDALARAPRLDDGDSPSTIGRIPDLVSRKGKFATYHATTGDPDVAAGLASSPVSAAMEPVVAGATLAAARAAMDVPLDLSVLYANRLINGDFRFFQRQAPGTPTSRADDTYGPDRWYVLTQTAAINVARVLEGAFGVHTMARLTQAQASAQRMGLAQIVESHLSQDLVGSSVALRMKLRCSVTTNAHVAILRWTGTADAVTSDVVNDWTSSSYTVGSGVFFANTTHAVVADTQVALTANTIADVTLSGAIASSATLSNFIVFVWTESAQAQNVTFDIGNAVLVEGDAAPAAFTPRPYGLELALCQRYYQKSYAADTAPAAATAIGRAAVQLVASAGNYRSNVRFAAEMRAAPTMSRWDAAGNASRVTAIDGALAETNNVNSASTAILDISPTGFSFNDSEGVGSAGANMRMSTTQWAGEAEL